MPMGPPHAHQLQMMMLMIWMAGVTMEVVVEEAQRQQVHQLLHHEEEAMQIWEFEESKPLALGYEKPTMGHPHRQLVLVGTSLPALLVCA